eukprot:TRINITY_DN9183_c0_g1_i7.p1 TRINITY_DN9183_c0_g1~~TRINITY_DN9183_c0_g1_i7.p1  ORF type:complete len:143 (-),score=10.34 TRINITY_DN9183_c0_g1_i7:198-626(-)
MNLLSLMPQTKVAPNTISYNAAISACQRGGQWQLALNLLSLMPQSEISPDAISYNAAIIACEEGGQWQLALDLIGLMPQSKVAPDAISYNSALILCKRRSAAVSFTAAKLDNSYRFLLATQNKKKMLRNEGRSTEADYCSQR